MNKPISEIQISIHAEVQSSLYTLNNIYIENEYTASPCSLRHVTTCTRLIACTENNPIIIFIRETYVQCLSAYWISVEILVVESCNAVVPWHHNMTIEQCALDVEDVAMRLTLLHCCCHFSQVDI